MAETGLNDKTTSRRSYFQQNRPSYSNRGRGRLDPHVSKALHNFGVSDLRELLDRKHQEQGQSKGGPPPDPSYSYLNDPLRENTNCDNQTRKYCNKDRPESISESYSRGRGSRSFRGRDGHMNRGDKCSQLDRTSIIQNPINIKIALTTSTGERSCKLDEKTKLVDIKHIYNHTSQERNTCKSVDGGDRERDEKSKAICENGEKRNDVNARKEFRGKSGQRMGHSWEGKGKYNNLSNNNNNRQYSGGKSSPNVKATEIPTVENWDTNYLISPLEGNEKKKKDIEKAYTQNSGEYEEHEEYYEVDEVKHLEIVKKSLLQRESEENLLITSSVPEINAVSEKRTVRFKQEDEQHDTVQSEQAVGKKSPEHEEYLNMQDNETELKANKTLKQKFPSKYEINQVKRAERKINGKKSKVSEKLKPADVAKVEKIKENTKKQIKPEAKEKLIYEGVLSTVEENSREANDSETKTQEKY